MVKQTVLCDRCGAIVLEGRSLLRIEAGPLRARREALDLCLKCADLLLAFLAGDAAPAAPAARPMVQGPS